MFSNEITADQLVSCSLHTVICMMQVIMQVSRCRFHDADCIMQASMQVHYAGLKFRSHSTGFMIEMHNASCYGQGSYDRYTSL